MHSIVAFRSATRVGLLAAVFGVIASVAGAQSEARRGSMSGLYLAVDAGGQNLIGGAFVSGVDVLSQARRRVVTLSVGGRIQTSFGTLFGAGLGLGFTDGDLELVDPSGPLRVDYTSQRQWDWHLTVGQALDGARRNMVYFYLSEVSRNFDVTITEPTRTFAQKDEQGLLRYGGGVEHALSNHLSVRLSAGTARGGFARQATNLVPRRLLEVMVGAVLRL